MLNIILKRSLFDFQFLDQDNLEENSIMDVDLNELTSSIKLLYII